MPCKKEKIKKCVKSVSKKKGKDSAWAICSASIKNKVRKHIKGE